tara:strand:- start:1191 stop:1397 length:207 start_codon:yes stop_codon:yes gene_type:complete
MSKIEGQPSLERDDNTMAVINTDTSAYKRYKAQKEKYRTQENEINTLKDELKEIKGLVKQLLERECNG